MAARNYNPDPYPISERIEDTLERYNMLKNPSGEPIMFQYPVQKVIRNTYPRHVGLMTGGAIKSVLEMDTQAPMSRPRGFISPHGKGREPMYIKNGNSASYPMYNSVEQKVLDGGNIMDEFGRFKNTLGRLANDPKVQHAAQKILNDPKNVQLRKLAANPEVQEIARATQKLVGSGRGRGRPRKHPALEGEGIWEGMNAWGKQNENNAKALFNSKQFQNVINDPRVQDLALKGLNKLVEGDGKKGKGIRGRPRKHPALEGEGIWEDMNAWGKQNEVNFNKFGRDVQKGFSDFARTAANIYNDPRVQAIINNPAVQKLGKKALKMAIGAIPGIGPMAREAMDMVGFGLRKGKPYTKMKMAMNGEGIWEDMNAWGKQNEVNFNKFGRDVQKGFSDFARTAANIYHDPRVQAIINNPAVQKLGKKALKMAIGAIPGIGPMAREAMDMVGFGLRKGKPYTKMKMIMTGDGIWEDMNNWGKQNERNAKALFNSKQFQNVINDPRVQDLALKGLNKLADGDGKKGKGLMDDMNAWGKANERNFNKFGKDYENWAANNRYGIAKSVRGGGSGTNRADIVKAIMAKHGMSLPAASKYVKQNGLY